MVGPAAWRGCSSYGRGPNSHDGARVIAAMPLEARGLAPRGGWLPRAKERWRAAERRSCQHCNTWHAQRGGQRSLVQRPKERRAVHPKKTLSVQARRFRAHHSGGTKMSTESLVTKLKSSSTRRANRPSGSATLYTMLIGATPCTKLISCFSLPAQAKNKGLGERQ